MPLLQLKEIVLRYGAAPLLDGVNLQVEPGERVCLLGRNGSGKTSLMRLISAEEAPSSGEVIRSNGVAITRLTQEIPANLPGSIREVLKTGIPDGRHVEEWEWDIRVDEIGSALGIPMEDAFASLSGGMKRRVLLARALAGEPDLLLLDEPTNHLDVTTIQWMERFLVSSKMAVLFVTHDRAFLRAISTRIVELDRGRLSSWDCNYDTYLERRQAALEAEEKQWAAFDKKLAQEEAWIRQGVKARRTRNEGRVRALEKLRLERRARRQHQGTAKIEIQEAGNSGQKVIDVQQVSFRYDNRPIINDFTATIWRGDKIGIIGPNGSGKTTLIKLLLGQLNPESGSVRQGTRLEVVYLDQMRAVIDDTKTVAQNVAGDAETVTFQGRARHIHSYLQDFLFPSDRVRMPARMLSGGERNRLLLARLFLQPANVLVLDEPTNDLDAETLELLEELLISYAGTLLVVSHDRAFLDNVVTGVFAFEGEGIVRDYIGGFSDWVKARAEAELALSKAENKDNKTRLKKDKSQKFLNREKWELEALPATIEALEKEQADISAKMWDPELYQNEPQKVADLKDRLAALEVELTQAYTRWDELELRRKECEG